MLGLQLEENKSAGFHVDLLSLHEKVESCSIGTSAQLLKIDKDGVSIQLQEL